MIVSRLLKSCATPPVSCPQSFEPLIVAHGGLGPLAMRELGVEPLGALEEEDQNDEQQQRSRDRDREQAAEGALPALGRLPPVVSPAAT